MNAPFSSYLTGIAPGLKELIGLLRKRYDYVSVLSTDSTGFSVSISQRAKSVSRETIATERGTVVRVYRDEVTENDKIEINFDKQGTKTLLLTHAKLEKI